MAHSDLVWRRKSWTSHAYDWDRLSQNWEAALAPDKAALAFKGHVTLSGEADDAQQRRRALDGFVAAIAAEREAVEALPADQRAAFDSAAIIRNKIREEQLLLFQDLPGIILDANDTVVHIAYETGGDPIYHTYERSDFSGNMRMKAGEHVRAFVFLTRSHPREDYYFVSAPKALSEKTPRERKPKPLTGKERL